jgi:hypothetical protein
MRLTTMAIVGLTFASMARGGHAARSPAPFADDQHIVYSDGLHSENTEMIRLGKRNLRMFRGGEEGQIGSARARLEIFESRDRGKSFTLLSEVNASNLPGDRDIRDPKFVQVGDKLFLYAISRLPGFHYRDFGGEAWTVRSESSDGGRTWTAPVKTYADGTVDDETFWGFWRFTSRRYKESGKRKRTLYATGYTDFDTAVGFFASDDGVTWTKRSTIIDSYDDVPSETELHFFGKNADTAVALVRLDNQDILADGQTAICTSHDPFDTWECGRRIEQRLDGPTWIVRGPRGRERSFVFARKHLPCTFKRTAIYELRGELTDPNAPIEVCEIQELESSGDTAYTSLAPLDANRSLLAWYSSAVDRELPWFEGISSPSDIWLARVDFRRAPKACTPPPVERSCPQPPLPTGTTAFDVTGSHLLTLAPVIWPAQTLSFRADVVVHGGTSLDLTLQPLDDLTNVPVGTPWLATSVPLSSAGEFVADFGTQAVPTAAYPLLNDPLLTVQQFVLHGVTTSSDAFCGSIAGYGQTYGTSPSDRIRLEGSTFGAVRLLNDALPAPVGACPTS